MKPRFRTPIKPLFEPVRCANPRCGRLFQNRMRGGSGVHGVYCSTTCANEKGKK